VSGRRPPTTSTIQAAVLVPVYRDAAGEPRLVLIVRAPGGPHGGQIAFPGGVREAADESLLATALREAEEEIGLLPIAVDVLTRLEDVDTRATGFTITPFLARIAPPPRWRPDHIEVAEVLDIPIAELMAPEVHGTRLASFPDWPEPREISFYRIGPHELWGATYRIVHPLLPDLWRGRWNV
jgi:8-oxo-dGTP pyrophosphatase MutT (NUDIX family)